MVYALNTKKGREKLPFKYPGGKSFTCNKPVKNNQPSEIKPVSYGKRGMTLEEDVNDTNDYYLSRGLAVIHKKPTPIQIVQVDYPKRSAAVIKEAYFKQASTTDYNGVYKSRYIDFEAKETKNKTSFPLQNFHLHQINHMKQVIEQGGLAFVIIRFSTKEETFVVHGQSLFGWWERMESGGRKSVTYDEITKDGYFVKTGLTPRLHYLPVIDQWLLQPVLQKESEE